MEGENQEGLESPGMARSHHFRRDDTSLGRVDTFAFGPTARCILRSLLRGLGLRGQTPQRPRKEIFEGPRKKSVFGVFWRQIFFGSPGLWHISNVTFEDLSFAPSFKLIGAMHGGLPKTRQNPIFRLKGKS